VAELNDILPRLEPWLGQLEADAVPLSGGITNRNFRVRLGGDDYVLRLHGANTSLLGIDREAERLANEQASRLGIAPAVAAAPAGCLVTDFVACAPLAPGELAARAEELARALRSFHELSLRLPSTFWVPDLLREYSRLLKARAAVPPPAFTQAQEAASRIARVLPLGQPRPCHNDLLPGNIIRAASDGRVMLVDWEYAGMGHPYFDLGNLAVNNDFDEATEERLLAAYHDEPPTPARRAALKLMRVMSDAREAAWGVLQAEISELDFDFERYGSTHFARLRAAVEQPNFEEWLASAAA
jgi:thiamine kinase-like enzyme